MDQALIPTSSSATTTTGTASGFVSFDVCIDDYANGFLPGRNTGLFLLVAAFILNVTVAIPLSVALAVALLVALAIMITISGSWGRITFG